MARPLEHAGALYHVTARGDRREDIFFAKFFNRIDPLRSLKGGAQAAR